jgi:DNA-binding LytR/AlgR family response regulator
MSDSEIKILMIDGRTLALRISLIPLLMVHRYSLVAIMLSFTAMFLLKPYEYLERSPSWFAAPFLFFTIIAMLLLIVANIFLFWLCLGRRRMITLPSTAFSTVIMMYLTDNLLVYLINDPRMTGFAFVVKCIFTAVFAEVVMFFYFSIIYPKVIEEQGVEPEMLPEEPIAFERRYIDAGGVPIAVGEVLYLEAQQSYVNIVTLARTYLVRRKFSECISDMPEDMGKQVHRSYWVNRCAVADFQRLNQYSFQIVLNNGFNVPVSRTRSTEIEKWFRDLKK